MKSSAPFSKESSESFEELEKQDLLERLRQTEKPTIPSVVLLSFIALLYTRYRPELRDNFTLLFVVIIILNILVFLFQLIVVPSRHYNQFISNLEAVVLSFFAAVAIALTGGFESPLYFSLYLIMLSIPINDIVTPLAMALIQEIFLALAVLAVPLLMQQFFQDPVKSLLLLLSPVGVAYFTTSMLYETLTEKREKEKARRLSKLLFEEKKKLETVLGGIGEMVIATDETGSIELLNGAVFETLGLRESGLLGKSFSRIFKNIDFNSDEGVFDAAITKRGGEVITFNVRRFPLIDGKGEKLGRIYVFRDVTSERELERMKIDFVSMAAHELRTPLTALRGYLSFLKDEVYGGLTDEQKSYLERARISSDSLSSLVDNLLNISRIESGNLELSLKEIDPVELLQPVIEQFRDRVKQKSQRLILRVGKGLGKVLADHFRVAEVLTNLLDNAINYTPPGGRVTVYLKAGEGEVVVSVKDSGPGIPETNLKHLFTKFYRVSNILSQGSKGTGLGLFICKSIIDMHHGRIWAESKPDKGSTFYFSLPLA